VLADLLTPSSRNGPGRNPRLSGVNHKEAYVKEYETVYITQPDLTDSQIGQLNDRVKSIVEKNKGAIFFARSMGTKKLAYPIAKKTKGIYYCLDYAADGDTVREIERAFRLNEDVVRFLTVVKSEKVDIEARRAEIAARGEDRPAEAKVEVESKVETEVEEEVEIEAEEEKENTEE
jgi:small subunit ribosomal protein S6